MDLELKNKVFIVTGGAKGIGKGIAVFLAQEGAIPFIVGRNENDILLATQEIHQNGGKASYAVAELTDPDQCKNAVFKAFEEFGTINGLVNNAGLNDGVSLETGTHDDFVLSLKRSVVHYFTMAHFCLPHLKKSKGAIVNIASKTSVTGQGGTSGYAAANGGRNALTREWAVELLPYGIRVNAIIVAECFTPQYQNWIKNFENPEERLKIIEDRIPLEKRMTTVEEIAHTTVFLLSNKSSHTTGQIVFVDGGYTHLDRAIE
ncbi:SDR family oxidoreductase [Maribacter sp. 2304DJ31-5]|uniref:SDR family oxidoreductase n=1 Tax=Maribacter sp. 2304DJ31-5 TaxID=3386273 RepID=UPI0039BCC587